MATVSGLPGTPTPYVPAGATKDSVPPEKRVIPSPEKQDPDVRRAPSARTTKESIPVFNIDTAEKNEKDTADGIEDASLKKEIRASSYETGLGVFDGTVVQELRDSSTNQVVERHPKKGCDEYIKHAAIEETSDNKRIQIAS
ncbi:MAG: hypothetical protein ACK5TR_03385 [Alphaproteobacteria bacterium]|jgi:hypothetical protein|nr:hypothetical protein [Alphaproteobacteria bacterium]